MTRKPPISPLCPHSMLPIILYVDATMRAPLFVHLLINLSSSGSWTEHLTAATAGWNLKWRCILPHCNFFHFQLGQVQLGLLVCLPALSTWPPRIQLCYPHQLPVEITVSLPFLPFVFSCKTLTHKLLLLDTNRHTILSNNASFIPLIFFSPRPPLSFG